MNKKYLPSALILYLNYFIHGIGCSILSQQVVKELLAEQWGMDGVMGVTAVAAALGLGRLISLPFAGPLSDKFGRRISVLIGCFSYVIFFVGIAFSPNMTIAYVAAVLGGIANSFLDTATYPAVAEIIYKYTGIATMGIKLFISVAQLLLPFFLGLCVGTSMSYLMLPLVCGIVIAVLGVLAIFAPLPKVEGVGKGESFLNNLKNAHFSLESVALILIGFTCTATFQLWLNCAQTFGTEVAGIASEDVSMMQTYYSAVRDERPDHQVQTGSFPCDLSGDLTGYAGTCIHDQEPDDLLCRSICDRLRRSRRRAADGNRCCERSVPEDQGYAYKSCHDRVQPVQLHDPDSGFQYECFRCYHHEHRDHCHRHSSRTLRKCKIRSAAEERRYIKISKTEDRQLADRPEKGSVRNAALLWLMQ